MDKASMGGTALMTGVVVLVCYQATGGDLMSLWSSKGFYMVILGTVAAVMMSMPFDRIKMVPGYIRKFLFNKTRPAMETIAMMSKLSEKARRDGILSLESDVASIPDAFVAAGLKMAVDGIDPDTIESTMRMEIMAMQDRHKSGKKFFDIIKTYGPGLGLIATLIGQIGMFKNLGGDIATMGYMLAVAVVATMYGTVLANCIAGPMGDKLAYRSGEEILAREMALQAILSIQAGENPRVTLDKMSAFIPASTREKAKAA
ncbi:MAG: MotA/TolQ/ExbB proton channel family protein [Phycisphaeraceae bacterium]|jgi:chemotaxis protein MotA|nr:MotA/TolQ/ExbB proton channel family protein [Phycisphaeraceae bacterium]